MSKPRTEYLNKEDAAKHTGLSVRRLLELAQRGTIRKQYIKSVESHRKIAVFAVEDLDRLKDPKSRWNMGGRDILPMSSPDAATLAALSHLIKSGERESENDTHKRVSPWLTLSDAESYIGLPEAFLASQIRAGKLPALDVGVRPGGRWRVSKRDLDAIGGEKHLAVV